MDPPPVQYATTDDGYSIAYSVCGEGEPLVFLPFAFSSIHQLWRMSWARATFEGLAASFKLVQYDSRGQGLSTRGLPPDLSLSDYLRDLEAVVSQVKIDRFLIYAETTLGHIGIRYAVQHPERVRGLALYDVSIRAVETPSLDNLARTDWETYLRIIGSAFAFEESRIEVSYLRDATTQEDWLQRREAARQSSVAEALPLLTMPVLVMATRSAPRDASVSPIFRECQEMARRVPQARFLPIDGLGSHFLPAGAEPPSIIKTLVDFQASLPAEAPATDSVQDSLSAREIEVLRLIAAGKSNAQIAETLVISPNTVGRHVSNIFDKIGAANRAEATAYAMRNGLV